MRLLLCTAFSHEIRPIIGNMTDVRREGRHPASFHGSQAGHRILVVETGMGGGVSGVIRAIDSFSPDAMISTGFCGSVTDDLAIGQVVGASSVSLLAGDGLAGTISLSAPFGKADGNHEPSAHFRKADFVTINRWIEKAAIAALLPPDSVLPVCDMETYHLARLAREKKLPFLALRSVSDGPGDTIGFDPRRLCDNHGVYSPLRAAAFFASQPSLWRRAAKLRRNSETASRHLVCGVEALLASRDLEIPSWPDS